MAEFTAANLQRWRQDPASFVEQCLIDPETGRPFVLLPVQRVFIKHAFTTDADGRLIYHEWVFSAPKKSGKTGFAALLTLTAVRLFGGK
jgi:phage terminase large subunit-like protein